MPVQFPDGKTVKVSFTVLQAETTAQIIVNVEWMAPVGVWEKIAKNGYVLDRYDPLAWQPKITVSGSSVEIEQIKSAAKPSGPRAYVEVSEEDLETPSGVSLPIHVVFPADTPTLKVVNPETLSLIVRFVKPPAAGTE